MPPLLFSISWNAPSLSRSLALENEKHTPPLLANTFTLFGQFVVDGAADLSVIPAPNQSLRAGVESESAIFFGVRVP